MQELLQLSATMVHLKENGCVGEHTHVHAHVSVHT